MRRSHDPQRGELTLQEYLEWRRTHPPIAGADGDESTDSTDASDDSTTASADTSGGTSGSQDDTQETGPFRLEDVPEDVRPHVERYNRLLQGDYTRKTQAIAEQRKRIERHQQLLDGLDSDDEDTRDAAIRQLLKDNGWNTDDDGTPPPASSAADSDPATTVTEHAPDPAEVARAAAQEAIDADRQQRAVDAFRAHAETALQAYAKEIGHQDGQLPEGERQAVMGLMVGLGEGEDGMPQIDNAIIARKADRAAIEQAVIGQHRQSKDVPEVHAQGTSSARTRTDLSDQKTRLARALEVAGRHV